MYQAIMLRKRRNPYSGFYIKNFESLDKLAKYIMSPSNLERCYRLKGLSLRKCRILSDKCYSIKYKESKS